MSIEITAELQDLIDELRRNVLAKLQIQGVDSIHPKDYNRIKTDDHWLKRFLLHNANDLDGALKMVMTSLAWRKENDVNEINDNNVRMDLIIRGAFFPFGEDIDGRKMIVFKSKMHSSGTANPDDLKRCIIYWFERVERMTKGEPITIFFDMEGCGLSNMDMDFTRYLIGLFKEYYPYFLNYIVIYELPWVLSAALKIVKSWLPEKGRDKIKLVNKKTIGTYVASESILKCWGGNNDYVFSFIPEEIHEKNNDSGNISAKKVHFQDKSPMSEQGPSPSGETREDGPLVIVPSSIITFNRDGNELISTLELQNTDSSSHIAFKLKTTSPEKFRVKPSSGCLKPGGKDTVTVTLSPGFQLGGLTKDKFLIMSLMVDEKEVTNLDMAEIWKNTSNKKIYQNRLRCVQTGEINANNRNGNFNSNQSNSLLGSGSGSGQDIEKHLMKLIDTVNSLNTKHHNLQQSVTFIQRTELITLIFCLFLAISMVYILNTPSRIDDHHSYCTNHNEL